MLGANGPTSHRRTRARHILHRFSDRTPLRTKLIAAVLALVVMALAAISITSVILLRSNLTQQQDPKLQALFGHYTSGSPPIQAQANVVYLQGSGMIAGVQAPGGEPLSQSNSNPGLPSMGGTRQQQSPPRLPTNHNWAGSGPEMVITVPAQSGGDSWRVMAKTVTYLDLSTNAVATGTFFVAVDLGPVNADIERLATVDLIVSVAIVIVLAVVAIAVVQTNLRPLNDIEMTAGEIATGHLNHRIPERDPRTEIGRLGRSLNTMLSQIEQAFHSQEESERAAHQSEERMRRFIADASHELRTPLTTIRGFAAHYRQRGGAVGRRPGVSAGIGTGAHHQIAPFRTDALVPDSPATYSHGEQAGDGMSSDDLDHLMGRVEAEATRMGLLVEDLLTLARLDQQRPLNFGPVDVLTLAVDAVQDARIVSPGRQIDLIVAPGTAFLVDGDEPRLRQVLSNLVNNALTHTPAGTPVRVKIASGTLVPPAGNLRRAPGTPPAPAVVLDVEDDGPGMTAEQAQRVFERFYRADAARNRASGGSGLGLAIVAGLVIAHGGTVSVRTAPGQGADFEVRLPLSPDAVPPEDPDDRL
jgi:two-component system, OmpR family, sensor kinase